MITSPLLVAWSIHDDLEQLHGNPVEIWHRWATGPITAARIDSGHHMAEENPDQLADVLVEFLGTIQL